MAAGIGFSLGYPIGGGLFQVLYTCYNSYSKRNSIIILLINIVVATSVSIMLIQIVDAARG